MLTKKERSKIGKQNRARGLRFENLVRKDLKSNGWIVDKWSNNVELPNKEGCGIEIQPHPKVKMPCGDIGGGKQIYCDSCEFGKLIQAKRKFNPFNKVMTIGVGFPDFIAYKIINIPYNADSTKAWINGEIIGCEVKSNGYLDKTEKQKCAWLIKNRIFSRILIAMKDPNKRGNILYKEFKNE